MTHFLSVGTGAASIVVGAFFLVMTTETRSKRRRILEAIRELRALAHIVDMHQIAKDPVMEHFRDNNQQEKMVEYLHACTCLLALLSKVAELYIEHFPDPVATTAVNNFEGVAMGMRIAIWMKISSMSGAKPSGLPMAALHRIHGMQ